MIAASSLVTTLFLMNGNQKQNNTLAEKKFFKSVFCFKVSSVYHPMYAFFRSSRLMMIPSRSPTQRAPDLKRARRNLTVNPIPPFQAGNANR